LASFFFAGACFNPRIRRVYHYLWCLILIHP
jgi:hypothetical protein